jgi:hypothetical protein
MLAAAKATALNNAETQYEEAIDYMDNLAHDFYSIAEADSRYLMTADHPDGPSPAAGVDAAKLDGHTLAEILAMTVPANAIGMFGAGSVPAGFAECNGSGGTPDYRGYIPRGAGSGVTPGTTGGNNAATPTCSFETPETTLTDNQIARHTHGYYDTQTATGSLGSTHTDAYQYGASDILRTTTTTEPGGITTRTAHKHTGCSLTWTGYKDEAGASQSGALDIRPACRAVKFIMRLPL